MLGKTTDPMLEQAEQGIQSKLPAKFQPILANVIKAGLTIMYSPSLKDTMMHRINTSNNPAQDAGNGATRMMAELSKQSGNKIPPQVMIPAAIIFAFEYLDLVEKAGKTQVNPQLIAHTVQAVTAAMLKMAGITPEKMHQLMISKQAGTTPAPSGIISNQMQGA